MKEDVIEKLALYRRIAASSFNDNGEIVPFKDQINNYALGSMPTNEIFIVAENISKYRLPINSNNPLVLTQSNLKKIIAHDISLKEIQSLDHWLAIHPLAMESITRPNALVIFADTKDVNGKEILIALHLNEIQGQKGFEVSVEDLASAYGKSDISFFINNTAKLQKRIYINDRTKDWLSRTGVQFPELASSPIFNEYTLKRISSWPEQNIFQLEKTPNYTPSVSAPLKEAAPPAAMRSFSSTEDMHAVTSRIAAQEHTRTPENPTRAATHLQDKPSPRDRLSER